MELGGFYLRYRGESRRLDWNVEAQGDGLTQQTGGKATERNCRGSMIRGDWNAMESTADEAERFYLLVVLARNVVVHRIVHNAYHSGHSEIGMILGIIYECSFCGDGILNLVYQAFSCLSVCLVALAML